MVFGNEYLTDSIRHLVVWPQVLFALTMAAMGISQTSALAPDFTKAKDSAASVFGILDRKSKIDASTADGITFASVKGDLELQHVSFKYPTRPDVQIFRDLCLSMPSGKVFLFISGPAMHTSYTTSYKFHVFHVCSQTIVIFLF